MPDQQEWILLRDLFEQGEEHLPAQLVRWFYPAALPVAEELGLRWLGLTTSPACPVEADGW